MSDPLSSTSARPARPHVVVVGGGLAGLLALTAFVFTVSAQKVLKLAEIHPQGYPTELADEEFAKLVASATEAGAETIGGGGDTLAAISALGNEEKFSFISTGGGAMLDFLAMGTLPGIQALG